MPHPEKEAEPRKQGSYASLLSAALEMVDALEDIPLYGDFPKDVIVMGAETRLRALLGLKPLER